MGRRVLLVMVLSACGGAPPGADAGVDSGPEVPPPAPAHLPLVGTQCDPLTPPAVRNWGCGNPGDGGHAVPVICRSPDINPAPSSYRWEDSRVCGSGAWCETGGRADTFYCAPDRSTSLAVEFYACKSAGAKACGNGEILRCDGMRWVSDAICPKTSPTHRPTCFDVGGIPSCR